MVFETLVFGGGEMDQEMARYSTWDEAASGHVLMVNRVREHLGVSATSPAMR
jgi:hypothetical protein